MKNARVQDVQRLSLGRWLGIGLFWVVWVGLVSQSSGQITTFVHPGGNESQDQLLFVKQQIASQNQPWLGQYNAMLPLATPLPAGGIPALPNENGQRDIAKSAYANALAYWYSGNVTYADNAVNILKAWANVAPYATADGQSKLGGAWMGSLLGPAAELVRNYMSPADRTIVSGMFRTVFYNSLQSPSGWNGNVELTQIAAAFNIAVFNEDTALFNYAKRRFAVRVPASIYLTSDGPTAIALPGAAWYSPNYTSPNVNGLMQETCRDFDHHAQFAMAALVSAAEVAYHQGVDLYGQYQTRIVSAMELMAKQLTTGDMQGVCTNGNVATNGIFNTFEIGYNHYRNVKGLPMTETAKVLPLVESANSDWNIFYETLTHRGAGGGPLTRCPRPNLGPDLSLCGQASLVLNSGISTSTNKTFTWLRNNSTIAGQTGRTYSATLAGTYKVRVDSAGGCSFTDSLVVSNALSVNLGATKNLCTPSIDTLDAGNAQVPGITYTWSTGANTRKIAIYKEGTYTVGVSTPGCAIARDTMVVTSNLLTVVWDTLCQAGVAQLSVSGASSYAWYAAVQGGTALDTTSNFNPSITSSRIYYVEDRGGVSITLGKTTQGTGQIWTIGTTDYTSSDKQLQVTVSKAMTLNSIAVYVVSANTDVTINFRQGGAVVYTKTVQGLGAGKQTIPLNFALAVGAYTVDAVGTTGQLYYEASGAAFPYTSTGNLSFTYSQNWQSGWYGSFYEWKATIGNTCGRTPVMAVVDPQNKKCTTIPLDLNYLAPKELTQKTETNEMVYPIPARDFVIIQSGLRLDEKPIQVVHSTGQVVTITARPISPTEWYLELKDVPDGLYMVLIGDRTYKLVVEK